MSEKNSTFNLKQLFAGDVVYYVPDYQRGYAWEEKQLEDFVTDIDDMVQENLESHYTGTLVLFHPNDKDQIKGCNKFSSMEIVDGQQRLTTILLYLSVILRKLSPFSSEDVADFTKEFLYKGDVFKLTLGDSDSDSLFQNLIRSGKALVSVTTISSKRILDAYNYLSHHIETQNFPDQKGYLDHLILAITNNLVFTKYEIEKESEIGMTFELMNSRGKDLTAFELLKNYLMYWVNRHVAGDEEKEISSRINLAWKNVYSNLQPGLGDEDQCLSTAWYLILNYEPKSWTGYVGFKLRENGFPIRTENVEKDKTRLLIFVEKMQDIARAYSRLTDLPDCSMNEKSANGWISKIKNIGIVYVFLPLLISLIIMREKGKLSEEDEISILKRIECYAYTVFLFGRHRSNSGRYSLNQLGYDFYNERIQPMDIIRQLNSLIEYYEPAINFQNDVEVVSDWYNYSSRLVKYTLYEYELYLIAQKNPNHQSQIRVDFQTVFSSSTSIEHILPQTPSDDSQWCQDWTEEEREKYVHDIGNLSLTQDNSSYSNFDFSRKKGGPSIARCYSSSMYVQERNLTLYSQWTSKVVQERHDMLAHWIMQRWANTALTIDPSLRLNNEEKASESDDDLST